MRHLLLFVAGLAAVAQPRVTAVGNGADFSAAVAPGSLAVVVGTGLSAAPAWATVPFPASLGGVSVRIGGQEARLSYVSPTQIQFQVPYGVAPGVAAVTVTSGSVVSNTVEVPVAATAPGLFQYGTNRGIIQNPDYTLNGPGSAARAGSTIVVYLTGIGLTDPTVADGAAAPTGPLAKAAATATATIGGAVTTVQFIGLTPGDVGVGQANLQVPNVTTGDHPLVISLNGVASKPVLVAVSGTSPGGGGSGGGGGGGSTVGGAPAGLTCVSGLVESISYSLQFKMPGLADEITIGSTRLCEKCDVKPPVFVEFVKKLEIAREDGVTVDACHDEAGRVNLVQFRR